MQLTLHPPQQNKARQLPLPSMWIQVVMAIVKATKLHPTSLHRPTQKCQQMQHRHRQRLLFRQQLPPLAQDCLRFWITTTATIEPRSSMLEHP
jgi:hypothetical protein